MTHSKVAMNSSLFANNNTKTIIIMFANNNTKTIIIQLKKHYFQRVQCNLKSDFHIYRCMVNS